MKVGLNVAERLTLMGVLPREGSFVTLKLLRGLADKVGLKDEEFKELGVKQSGDKVEWNAKGIEPKEFEFGEKETDIIKEALQELDKSKKLSQQTYSLFEKFIEGAQNG